jgi:hypothetical protein
LEPPELFRHAVIDGVSRLQLPAPLPTEEEGGTGDVQLSVTFLAKGRFTFVCTALDSDSGFPMTSGKLTVVVD